MAGIEEGLDPEIESVKQYYREALGTDRLDDPDSMTDRDLNNLLGDLDKEYFKYGTDETDLGGGVSDSARVTNEARRTVLTVLRERASDIRNERGNSARGIALRVLRDSNEEMGKKSTLQEIAQQIGEKGRSLNGKEGERTGVSNTGGDVTTLDRDIASRKDEIRRIANKFWLEGPDDTLLARYEDARKRLFDDMIPKSKEFRNELWEPIIAELDRKLHDTRGKVTHRIVRSEGSTLERLGYDGVLSDKSIGDLRLILKKLDDKLADGGLEDGIDKRSYLDLRSKVAMNIAILTDYDLQGVLFQHEIEHELEEFERTIDTTDEDVKSLNRRLVDLEREISMIPDDMTENSHILREVKKKLIEIVRRKRDSMVIEGLREGDDGEIRTGPWEELVWDASLEQGFNSPNWERGGQFWQGDNVVPRGRVLGGIVDYLRSAQDMIGRMSFRRQVDFEFQANWDTLEEDGFELQGPERNAAVIRDLIRARYEDVGEDPPLIDERVIANADNPDARNVLRTMRIRDGVVYVTVLDRETGTPREEPVARNGVIEESEYGDGFQRILDSIDKKAISERDGHGDIPIRDIGDDIGRDMLIASYEESITNFLSSALENRRVIRQIHDYHTRGDANGVAIETRRKKVYYDKMTEIHTNMKKMERMIGPDESLGIRNRVYEQWEDDLGLKDEPLVASEIANRPSVVLKYLRDKAAGIRVRLETLRDTERLKRLKDYVKENALPLGGIMVGIAALVTTVVIGTRKAAVKGAGGIKKFGEAIGRFSKKVWPVVGGLLSMLAVAIGWGSSAIMWLASNLWVVVLALVIAFLQWFFSKGAGKSASKAGRAIRRR